MASFSNADAIGIQQKRTRSPAQKTIFLLCPFQTDGALVV